MFKFEDYFQGHGLDRYERAVVAQAYEIFCASEKEYWKHIEINKGMEGADVADRRLVMMDAYEALYGTRKAMGMVQALSIRHAYDPSATPSEAFLPCDSALCGMYQAGVTLADIAKAQ